MWDRNTLTKFFEEEKTRKGWVRRTNEIKKIYKEASIVNVVKTKRLRWLGHIERMLEISVTKMVLARTIWGKKRRIESKMENRGEERHTTTTICKMQKKHMASVIFLC